MAGNSGAMVTNMIMNSNILAGVMVITTVLVTSLPLHAVQPMIGMYGTVCDTEQQTIEMIAKYKAAGVRTIFPSLSGGDTVIWKTDKATYYPSLRARYDEGYDALKVLIQHAHAAGMKVYPSVVCGMGGLMLNAHPEWETRDRNGQPASKTAAAYFSFSIAQARAAKIAMLMDLVNQYDIDGIFLDECNYPVNSATVETHYGFYGYDAPLMNVCRSIYGFDPARVPINSPQWNLFNEMRIETVTAFVRELRAAIKATGKPVRMGIYADADYDMERRSCGRDYVNWVKLGLVDDVFLSTYIEKIGEMERTVARVRAAVGPKVSLYSALCPFNEFLKTNEEMVAAAKAQLSGGADGLWVYRDDYVDKLKLWNGVRDANQLIGAHQ
ncbi:MAG: family 10 glycosylhydrolase [Phycisphaerales bacterium]|nr:family 10 glycosylhydrolase [Phycisphaerales bacterium]